MDTPAIFCLEGEWDSGNIDSRLTVKPLLDLLEGMERSGWNVHRTAATRAEVTFQLRRWADASGTDYPLGYLAFHGGPGFIEVNDESMSLNDVATILGTDAAGRVLHFGSCGTVAVEEDELREFCRSTGLKGVVGYTRSIAWAESAAFDILLLTALLEAKRLRPLLKRLSAENPHLVGGLGLRIATASWVGPVANEV